MKYLNNQIDYFRKNILEWNVNFLIYIASIFQFVEGMSALIAFFGLLWILFYKNIDFTKQALNNKRMNFIEKNAFLFVSIVIGLFYVMPFLFCKFMYFEVDLELELVINYILSCYKRLWKYINNNLTIDQNNAYPKELISSKLFLRWRN